MIQVTHLDYTYPDGKQALRDITFRIEDGEKIALLGPNGAGKSTLLLHLNGILLGNGTVVIDGLILKKENLPEIRARLGIVFQNSEDQLFSPTVYEDVAYGPIYQGLEKQEIQERIREALLQVGLKGYEGRNPYHLSSGEKKRAAIATVLSMKPSILIFDEPSAGLDPRARRELISLLQGLPQTMIIATHDLDMAKRLTEQTIIMDGGRIVCMGKTQDILTQDEILWEHGLR
jgi:cobalt transport protein ATP-binding subunit